MHLFNGNTRRFRIFAWSFSCLMLKTFPILAFILLLSFSTQSQVKEASLTTHQPVSNLKVVDTTELITFARQYLGTPYHKASTDPAKGFDCSGFVYFVFHHFNVTLPRSSREYKGIGKALKPEEFKVGDILVFYGYKDKTHIGHVGIICEAHGMKSRFIHASSGKAYSVTISELNSAGYRRRFYKCIDVID